MVGQMFLIEFTLKGGSLEIGIELHQFLPSAEVLFFAIPFVSFSCLEDDLFHEESYSRNHN